MRQDGKRRVRVFADLDERLANAEQILQTLEQGFFDEVIGDYNGMSYVLGGQRQQVNESLESLFDGFTMAILIILALLASMLRSYVQPIVIVVAVPFGLVGAVVGHALMGFDLTMMSLFGVVALSGVVVNDSLVLVDAINRGMREGKSVREAVLASGELRFRAVILTTLTTVAGLLPLLLERSGQAISVLPMAISLAFGLLFATGLTLFLVPALFLIVNDARRFVSWIWHGGDYPSAEQMEEAVADRSLTRD
jgi:multidrug efflux pump subunit AcrB